MTFPFTQGRLTARLARSDEDVLSCQRLRHLCFFGRAGVDQDQFDQACEHLMVFDESDDLVATARVMQLSDGQQIDQCYSAQFYDLSAFSTFDSPLLEIGRFCIAPGTQGADVLRLSWAALTHIVDAQGAGTLFGCTSFSGIDPAPHSRSFGCLMNRHQGPTHLRPTIRASDVIPFEGLQEERPMTYR